MQFRAPNIRVAHKFPFRTRPARRRLQFALMSALLTGFEQRRAKPQTSPKIDFQIGDALDLTMAQRLPAMLIHRERRALQPAASIQAVREVHRRNAGVLQPLHSLLHGANTGSVSLRGSAAAASTGALWAEPRGTTCSLLHLQRASGQQQPAGMSPTPQSASHAHLRVVAASAEHNQGRRAVPPVRTRFAAQASHLV